MIELYKIFSGKYDSEMTEWITGKCIKRQYDTRNHIVLHCISHIFITIYVNLVFITELSRYGIV